MTTELDRPVPLYMQVVRQLRAQIASGEIAEGDRLPSQREMMARWHISMQTASKVIGAMKTEGIAVPSVGRDTVVASGAAARIAAAAEGTAHANIAPAPAPGASVTDVSAGKAAAPAYVAEILGIPSGRRALRRRETRSRNDRITNVILWYPPAIAERAPHLADSHPLAAGTLAYITETTGIRATRVQEEHVAAPADEDSAAVLGVAPGSPVLITCTRYYATDGKLIEYSEVVSPAGLGHTRTFAIGA